jgi:hypothetical protein
MRKSLRWIIAFILMCFLGVAFATVTSNYVNAILNPVQFIYTGNTYMETAYEISADMEHKTSGTSLYDFSGHSPTRDLRIPTPQGPTAAAGKYGNGYRWAFPSNRAINGTDLGIVSESFTIEAWLNPQLPQISDPTVCWAGMPNELNVRRLFVAPNGSAWAQMTDPLVNFYSSVALPTDSWTHVAFVYNSDQGRISWIINGILDRTSESSYVSSWSGEFKIGGWNETASYRWNGKIDEFRVKKAAMDPLQVADDMNRPIQKIVRLSGLKPNSDIAVLSLTGVGAAQPVIADGAGNADFDVYDYGPSFEGLFGRFSVIRSDQTIESGQLPFFTGDEYKFTYTQLLDPSLVFLLIAVAFPLGTAIVYALRRLASRRSSTK